MKTFLLGLVFCPACCTFEEPLRCSILHQEGDDILSGELSCPVCAATYTIREGIGFLLPQERSSAFSPAYESPEVLESYLWGHYADLWEDPDHCPAYQHWSALLNPLGGLALDAGCAVGRFTLELTRKAEQVVGVDTSLGFIRTARALAAGAHLSFSLTLEGHLHLPMEFSLKGRWSTQQVEFVVADVQALPFAPGTFTSLASLNIVDKLLHPLEHLRELDGVALEKGAQILVSDPFSWLSSPAREEEWLGGHPEGAWAGLGIENLRKILEERRGLGPGPPWNLERQGAIWWRLRKHANLFELIRSRFVKAVR